MKRIFLLLFMPFIFNGCGVENLTIVEPVMLTYEPENVLTTSASLGGEVLSEGGKDVSEYGIVYSTTATPTIESNKITEGTRVGEFKKTYDIFEPGVTYYYRTYARNDAGVGYGETYSFTTQEQAPCNPEEDNVIDIENYFSFHINHVKHDGYGYPEGNIEFVATFQSSTIVIRLSFNEIDARLPLTGTYTTGYAFDNDDEQSVGAVYCVLYNYGSSIGGGIPPNGSKIYVENHNNGEVTFIFCDFYINDTYTINGKFTFPE